VRPALAVVVMAAAGLADSVYLTAVHYSGGALACASSGVVNCDLVTRSSYGYVPSTSLPVAVLGLAWFFVALCLGAALLFSARSVVLWAALLVWSAAGIAPVLYLVWAELVPLHHLCEYCTVAHVLVLATLVLALARTLGLAAERQMEGAEP
jgi:uncharacterized membrane protein